MNKVFLGVFSAFVLLFVSASNALAATVVSPVDQENWGFAVGNAVDGVGEFVEGPATPPLGTGSAHISTGTDGSTSSSIHTTGYAGQSLAEVVEISYSTYAVNTNLPRIVIDVQTGVGLDQLTFDPQLQSSQTPQANTWQTWTNAQNGIWQSANFGGFGGGTIQEYIDFLSAFTTQVDVVNRPDTTGGIRFQVGLQATQDVFDGNVDNATIQFTELGDTYDFEKFVLTCEDADIDDSNDVDLTDTIIILDHFGESGLSIYDQNRDGLTDITDAIINLDHFGEECAP